MPKILLSGKHNTAGLNISYKVCGEKPKENNPVFIVHLTPPPFSSRFAYKAVDDYANDKKIPEHNSILIDFPGCGESDRSVTPERHYTIEFFTLVIVDVLQHISNQFPGRKQIFIEANDFSSIVALNLLQFMPSWSSGEADICIRAISTFNPLIDNDNWKRALRVKSKLKDDPNLKDYLGAIARLEQGLLIDAADFISDVQLKLLPLAMNVNPVVKELIRFCKTFPEALISLTNGVHTIFPNSLMLEIAQESFRPSIEVMNEISRNKNKSFDLLAAIMNKPEPYRDILIVSIFSDNNVLDPASAHSNLIKGVLPESVLEIKFPGKEMETLSEKIAVRRALFTGELGKHISAQDEPIRQKYLQIKNDLAKKPRSLSSTASAMQVVGTNKVEAPRPVEEKKKSDDDIAVLRSNDHDLNSRFEIRI